MSLAEEDNFRNQNNRYYYLGPLGQMLDNMMGGNPNPTFGQMYGASRGFEGYGFGYGYHYGGW
jgi:hypothetical protein